jgi:hypothetical protein
MNISINATRVPTERLLGVFLRLLRKTAAEIDDEIGTRLRSSAGGAGAYRPVGRGER